MAPSELPRPGRPVLVYTATSLADGLVARGLLQAEGVPVFAKGEQEGPYRVGLMYLWVPEEHAAQARAILAAEAVEEADASGNGGP